MAPRDDSVIESPPTPEEDREQPGAGTEQGADELLAAAQLGCNQSVDLQLGIGAAQPASSIAEQLTETLRVANAPPAAALGLSELNDANEASRQLLLAEGDVFMGSGGSLLEVVNLGGSVRPGHSPGVMNVGSFAKAKEGETVIEITGWNANNSPVVYDQILASGNVVLDGTLRIEFPDPPNFIPAAGQTFPILKWGGVRVGEFAYYLGTSIPADDQLAFEVVCDDAGKQLLLKTVDTESVAVEVERAILNVANFVGQALNLGAGATGIAVIDRALAQLIKGKQNIENTIQQKLFDLINGLTTQAQVTVFGSVRERAIL